jgi:hypothetical protein
MYNAYPGEDYKRYKEHQWPPGVRLYCYTKRNHFKVFFEEQRLYKEWLVLLTPEQKKDLPSPAWFSLCKGIANIPI